MIPLQARIKVWVVLIGLMFNIGAVAAQPASDPRVTDLVRAGELRVALFAAQYTQDTVTGEIRGVVHLAETARVLAARLGVKLVLVGYPSPLAAVEGLKEGSSDVAFLGVEPSWAAAVDFSVPVFELDYTFLVPFGSAIHSAADADQPGVRIAAARNHGSTLALSRAMKNATLVYGDTPDLSFTVLQTKQADLMASTANGLYSYSARLQGSRVLEDRYGFAEMGLAVRKGRAERLAYFNEAMEEAKEAGLIQHAIELGTIRGMRAAPSARLSVPR